MGVLMFNNQKTIPVLRPLLPSADAIFPYLKKIDENRWYANFGPLVTSLERRLEELFRVEHGSIVTASNGTAALTNVMRAMNLPQGSFCIVPSWTFIAVPAAARAVGLKPYFVDVDEKTWALDPENVKKAIAKIPGKVSSLIYVAPFGSVPPTSKWDEFYKETGIRVIIDCAAGFDVASKNPEIFSENIPMMVSLHATKTFGVGEGGVIICKNKEFIRQVRQMSNFGFSGSRMITISGTNGKMNEYNAAVANAELDNWPNKRTKWQRITDYYIDKLKKLSIPYFLSSEYISSTCNILVPHGSSDSVISNLAGKGVEARKWWFHGCHRQFAYLDCLYDQLPITEKLVGSVVGLPFYVDISDEDIDYVCKALNHSLSELGVKELVEGVVG